MTQIIVDAETRRKLRDLKVPLELCDEAGVVLALLTPVPIADPPGWIRDEPPPISEAEWTRIIQQPGYTTAEVLAYLESL